MQLKVLLWSACLPVWAHAGVRKRKYQFYSRKRKKDGLRDKSKWKYYSLSTYGVANGADVMLSKTQEAYVVTCTDHLLAYHVGGYMQLH